MGKTMSLMLYFYLIVLSAAVVTAHVSRMALAGAVLRYRNRVSMYVSANDPGANDLALKFLQTRWQLARSYQMWQCLQGLRYKYWAPQEAASCNGLHLAAMFGLNDLIPRHLDTCSIDEPTHLGTTALVNAASCGHKDLVHLLLTLGADPGRKNWYGTALHCATDVNQVETIHTLCDFRTKIDIIDDHGRTTLSCAAQSGRSNSLRALLDRGASVDLYHWDQGTGLHRATLHGEMIDVIQILLTFRADPNLSDPDGFAPLHNIARNDEGESVAQMLLDHGANVNQSGKGGQTPLQCAVMANNRGLVRLYLGQGADINAQDSNGATSLHSAVNASNLEMVDLLLEKKRLLLDSPTAKAIHHCTSR